MPKSGTPTDYPANLWVSRTFLLSAIFHQSAGVHLCGQFFAFSGEPAGLPGWGYWGEVGVVSDAGYRERMARAGLESINREEGMEGLESLLAGPFEQMALVKINRDEQQALSPLGERERVKAYPARIPAGIEILEGEQQ